MAEDNDGPFDLLDELLKIETSEDSDFFREENAKLAPLLDEINLIMDQGIRHLVRALLFAAGPEFWEIPSSFSGKHHPPDENQPGGNVLHTKRVVRLITKMCDSQDRDQIERDVAVAAGLLHDLRKGVEWADGTFHYDPMHPYTIDQFFNEVRKNESADEVTIRSTTLQVEEAYLFEIFHAVHCHLGPWSPIPETYPNAALDWVVHFADNIATHLHQIVDDPNDWKPERWQK